MPSRRSASIKPVDRLFAAYRHTTYIAHTEIGDIRLRPGRRNVRLERLLALHKATSWAFITASNPGSVQQPAKVNETGHQQLLRSVRRRGLRSWSGEGVGDDGRWRPETSLLILDVEEEPARALGRKFGQVAILVGRIGGIARLVGCVAATGK